MGKISGAQAIADDIIAEVERAATKFPQWPTDPFHALAVVNEEVGELNKAVLQLMYEPNKGVRVSDLRSEAVQSAAMLIRFLVSLDRNDYKVRANVREGGGPTAPAQHEQ